mmetsp:Transcript_27798/g.51386  ORF Transcript_27798/g.51386 Transcript_27798/m.51386 type:complete len:383 (+) Transcript_27798:106-1254(+)
MASLMRKLRMKHETITEDEARELLKNQLESLKYSKNLEQLGIASADEYLKKYVERVNDEARITNIICDPQIPSDVKMNLKCENIIKWGKLLYACDGCWLLPGNCVCKKMDKVSFDNVHVVVHLHHAEWGRGSNSGTVLHQSIKGSEMIMHYHKPHDERMKEILEDPSSLPVVLWPGDSALLPSEVKALAAERTGGRVTVIALDATWANARRLCFSYPKDTIFVKLPPENALGDHAKSILAPVRCYGGDAAENGRVSTLEATAALLLELTGDRTAYDTLLDNLKYKVDVMRMQNSRDPVYGKATKLDKERKPSRSFQAMWDAQVKVAKTWVRKAKRKAKVVASNHGEVLAGGTLLAMATAAVVISITVGSSLLKSLERSKTSV